MPYLNQNQKENIDNKGGYDVYDKFGSLDIKDLVGALNYLNFRIVKIWIGRNGKKYFVFAAIVGTLVCCIFEIYRKLIAPYEEEKIKENGDII